MTRTWVASHMLLSCPEHAGSGHLALLPLPTLHREALVELVLAQNMPEPQSELRAHSRPALHLHLHNSTINVHMCCLHKVLAKYESQNVLQ